MKPRRGTLTIRRFLCSRIIPPLSLAASEARRRGRASGRRVEHERRRRGDEGIENGVRKSSGHSGSRKRKLIGNLAEVDDILGCTVRGENLKPKEWENRKVAESRF